MLRTRHGSARDHYETGLGDWRNHSDRRTRRAGQRRTARPNPGSHGSAGGRLDRGSGFGQFCRSRNRHTALDRTGTTGDRPFDSHRRFGRTGASPAHGAGLGYAGQRRGRRHPSRRRRGTAAAGRLRRRAAGASRCATPTKLTLPRYNNRRLPKSNNWEGGSNASATSRSARPSPSIWVGPGAGEPPGSNT